MFWKESDGPERDCKIVYSSGPEKDQLEAIGGSTAAAVWCWLTAEEAEGGLVAAYVLAVQWWWLQERRLVLACWQVKWLRCVNLLVTHHRLKISKEA